MNALSADIPCASLVPCTGVTVSYYVGASAPLNHLSSSPDLTDTKLQKTACYYVPIILSLRTYSIFQVN